MSRTINSRALAALLLFFCFVFATGSTAEAIGRRLPVLVYHHIETQIKSDVSCTPTQFSLQLEALLRENYTPLTLDQARLYLAGCLSGIPRTVLITFDDGYESIFHYALPVAKLYRIPMTVFVVTSRLGLKPQFTRYLSEAQIRLLADSGLFFFGSHTHDLHVNVLTLFRAFQTAPNPVLRLVADDLLASKEKLESILHQNVYALAWPYGKYNDALRKLARDCGFYLHFTSQAGFNEPGADPFSIKRLPVTSRDTPASILQKLGN